MRSPSIRRVLMSVRYKAKRIDAIDNAIRYNPLYYQGVAQLLRNVESMDRAQRQELVDRLTERTLGWARAAGARMPVGAGIADWPLLEKEDVRRREDDYECF